MGSKITNLNLRHIEGGDIVITRDGQRLVVEEYSIKPADAYPVGLIFEGGIVFEKDKVEEWTDYSENVYTDTGHYWENGEESELDIVEVIKQNVPTQLGAKYDGGKLNFRAFSRGLAKPIKAIAAVLTYGCEKYAEDSWQQVPNGKARYESALDRHMNAWKDGEKYDEESGLPHLAHAACNMMFVLWFELTDGSLDDKDYTTYNKPPVRG